MTGLTAEERKGLDEKVLYERSVEKLDVGAEKERMEQETHEKTGGKDTLTVTEVSPDKEKIDMKDGEVTIEQESSKQVEGKDALAPAEACLERVADKLDARLEKTRMEQERHERTGGKDVLTLKVASLEGEEFVLKSREETLQKERSEKMDGKDAVAPAEASWKEAPLEETPPEEAFIYSPEQELTRALLCVALVFAFWASLFGGLAIVRGQFMAPSCRNEDPEMKVGAVGNDTFGNQTFDRQTLGNETFGNHMSSVSSGNQLSEQLLVDQTIGNQTRLLASLGLGAAWAGGVGSCEPCGDGTVVAPIWGEWEQTWPKQIRIPLYACGLLWGLLGMYVATDPFTSAIEEIASTERVVWLEVASSTKHKFHVKVWNPVLINTALVPLSTAMPEIILAIYENMGNDFFDKGLGPSTVVSTGALNLLMCTALCIFAIPSPDIRKIEGTKVYMVAASASILAYSWLLLILQLITPARIDVWEGVMTVGMFPVFVTLSVVAHKGCGNGCKRRRSSQTERHVEDEQRRLQMLYGKPLGSKLVKQMLEIDERRTAAQGVTKLTRAKLRKEVMRGVTGGTKRGGQNELTIGFDHRSHVCLECAGSLSVRVVASQPPTCPLELTYCTRRGTAVENKDYRHVEGILRFGPGQQERVIQVQIVDQEIWEPTRDFQIELSNLRVASPAPMQQLAVPPFKLGQSITTVTIVHDDEPGTLQFTVSELGVSSGASACMAVVKRTAGSCGSISCKYKTEDSSAIAGKDYVATSGVLTFDDGVLQQTIEVPILDTASHNQSDEAFRLVLHDASLGVRFSAETDGGPNCDVLTVRIFGNRQQKCCVWRGCSKLNQQRWVEQISTATYCCGAPEEQYAATCLDWCVHFVMLPFKLFVALAVPPPTLCGGWPCFFASLVAMAMVIAFIGDLASLLGCLLDVDSYLMGMWLIAFGTNLPDMIAIKAVAQASDTADASLGALPVDIAVSIFLGLGVPWTIAAIYWERSGVPLAWRECEFRGESYESLYGSTYPDGGFMVPGYNILSFCVGFFLSLSCIVYGFLFLRRHMYGGELGGPRCLKARDSAILLLLLASYSVSAIIFYAKEYDES